jgi:hypothetical protein
MRVRLDTRTYTNAVLTVIACLLVMLALHCYRVSVVSSATAQTMIGTDRAASDRDPTVRYTEDRALAEATRDVAAANREIAAAIQDLARSVGSAASTMGASKASGGAAGSTGGTTVEIK